MIDPNVQEWQKAFSKFGQCKKKVYLILNILPDTRNNSYLFLNIKYCECFTCVIIQRC